MLPPSILARVHGALCRLGTVPGTKLTSSYRGVSVNGSTGMWTAVVWNPQTRAAQHIGDYTSELEVSFGSHITTLPCYDSDCECDLKYSSSLKFRSYSELRFLLKAKANAKPWV